MIVLFLDLNQYQVILYFGHYYLKIGQLASQLESLLANMKFYHSREIIKRGFFNSNLDCSTEMISSDQILQTNLNLHSEARNFYSRLDNSSQNDLPPFGPACSY